jgi:hypothetical protein
VYPPVVPEEAPKVGVASCVNDVPVVLAEFVKKPFLFAVTVHVAVTLLPRPVTVTTPEAWVALPPLSTEKEYATVAS